MKVKIKKCSVLFVIIAIVIIGLKIIFLTNEVGEMLLKITNYPAYFLLTSANPAWTSPVIMNQNKWQEIWLYMPYYVFYVLTYKWYGNLLDLFISKFKDKKK